MAEMKTSKLLTMLMDAARKLGNAKNPPFTAERFLVAVLDQMNAPADQGADCEVADELKTLSAKVGKLVKDTKAAREALMSYICQESGRVFLDDLYMKNKMQKASASAESAGSPLLDAVTLMTFIAEDPSETIRDAFAKEAATTAEPAEKADEPAPAKGNSIQADLQALVAEARRKKEAGEPAPAETPAEPPVAPPVVPSVAPQVETKPDEGVKTEMGALVAEIKRIRSQLKESVYGQDNAINVFVTGFFQANMLSMIDKSRKRPRATFLFAGPPGVGKTFLAEKVAETLQLPFQRFDMSEYSDKEANLEFCGSDKVYKGAKEGNVTGFVAEHPKCVLLFDEIEKAHISVIHLFLQMLDAGRLRDNFTDKEISFSDAIIILTTNAGRQLYTESETGDFSTVSRKVIIKALETDVNPSTGMPFFPGAICSRFASGNVVMFNHIGAHDLRAIAKKEIQRHVKSLEKESGIHIDIDEHVYTALLFSEGSNADARTIRARAETFFNDELYELLRLIASDKVKTSVDNVTNIRIGVDLSQTNADIRALFTASERTKILMVASPETVAACKEKAPEFDVVGVQDAEEAIKVFKKQSIDFVLLDMVHGAPVAAMTNLNIEDVDSPARDFFKFLKEQRSAVPVYLLEDHGITLNEEERISFMRQGVRGVLGVSDTEAPFAAQLDNIASILHQQASMVKLARENKLVSFETAQSVSENGQSAGIKLFDFAMAVAVDSEDAKNIMSSMSKPNVHFADVIGAEDAKKELTYFVEYLKNPKKYMGTGVKAPKGVILYGPPGTGKTMLAKAMACEAGVTFIAAEGNQFLQRWVGAGPEKVHELFKTARKYAPSILFVDEIDAIAKERQGGSDSGSNGEDVLTAFLAEMDGFVSDPSKPVFVLAATNFDVEPGGRKSLDPALMRRFDRRVYIDLPNKEERIRFLNMKIAKNQALQISAQQIDSLAMRSTGMSLAELDSVVELALRSAIREGSTVVNDDILEEAFETFNGGEVKKWGISQLECTARHEAGHALLYWLNGDTPSYLTIVARGNHGGYMRHADKEDKQLYTIDDMLGLIRTSLGGRAAELVYYGERNGVSTGASGDLANATRTAQRMICAYGMDADFGLAVVPTAAITDGPLAVEIRAAVNRILNEQLAEAVRLISENKSKIDALVEALMSRNHLNGVEIDEILSKA